MISYRKLLEDNGIYDLDYIDENGDFYREYKPIDENITVGYRGNINYDENGVHLMYIKEQSLSYESYLDDTPLFNTQYYNYFIVENCDNNYFAIEIANNEIKDLKELYNSYVKNPTLFIEKQELLMRLQNIDEKIKNLQEHKEVLFTRIRKIDESIKK